MHNSHFSVTHHFNQFRFAKNSMQHCAIPQNHLTVHQETWQGIEDTYLSLPPFLLPTWQKGSIQKTKQLVPWCRHFNVQFCLPISSPIASWHHYFWDRAIPLHLGCFVISFWAYPKAVPLGLMDIPIDSNRGLDFRDVCFKREQHFKFISSSGNVQILWIGSISPDITTLIISKFSQY